MGAFSTFGAAVIFLIIFFKYPVGFSFLTRGHHLFPAMLSFGLFFIFLEEIRTYLKIKIRVPGKA